MDTKLIEALVKKMEKENQLYTIVSLKSEPAVAKGENYTSVILRASLDVVLRSGKQSKRSVIIKTYPESENHFHFVKKMAIFDREIKVFTEVLTRMEEVMEEHNDFEEKNWCNLIGYRRDDTIIFEDLSKRNYVVIKRQVMMNLSQSLLVVQAIARFHALGRRLYEENSLRPEEFSSFVFLKKEFIDKAMVPVFKRFAQIVEDEWGPKWKARGKKILEQTDLLSDRLQALYKKESSFSVLNHGDMWTSNVMLTNDKKSHVKFIDFQMCHFHSFAWDLIYFLTNGVDPGVRKSSYNEIVEAYHNALVEYCRIYKIQTKVPTLRQILDEISNFRYFQIILLTCVHPILTAEISNAYDMESINDSMGGLNDEILKVPKFRQRIEDYLEDFVQQNFYSDDFC